jgi:hypothetical protein
MFLYDHRLQSSWTHLITPSRNFVEVRWRSLFRSRSLGKRCTSYNAPPTSRKRAADRWSRRNTLPLNSLFVFGKPLKSHGVRSGLCGRCSDGVPPILFFQAEHRFQFRSRPMQFLGFSNHEKEAPRQEISKWSTVCSTFSRSGWSVVRRARLAKGGTSKKRPSPHLHKVPNQSNKVSPRTLETALVCVCVCVSFIPSSICNFFWKLIWSLSQRYILNLLTSCTTTSFSRTWLRGVPCDQ